MQYFLHSNDLVIERFYIFKIISLQYDGASLMIHPIHSFAFNVIGIGDSLRGFPSKYWPNPVWNPRSAAKETLSFS